MKLINSSAEILYDINPYKHIEKIGRICYKSENLITEDSCYKFVDRLVRAKHFAILEHARIEFIIEDFEQYNINLEDIIHIPALHFKSLGMSPNTVNLNISMSHLYNPKWSKYPDVFHLFQILKNVVESEFKPDIDYIRPSNIKFIQETSYEIQASHLTMKFIVDRGISHELVRHRCAAAQSSTRYCDYSKDKFGSEITFVKPSEYDSWTGQVKTMFDESMQQAENTYLWLVTKGKLTPEIARSWLPHALMTEVVLTMDVDQWNHFFDLRLYGTTGKPHPDMEDVCKKAKILFDEATNLSFI